MTGGRTTDVLGEPPIGARAPPIAGPKISATRPSGACDPLRAGDRVGPYRVRRCLGVGPDRLVYAAWDPAIARPVALVVLRPRGSDRLSECARFVEHARARARVRHVNVSEVYALGTSRGLPYVAMESPAGQTLRLRLLRASRGLALAEASAVFEALCRGAQAIHDAGLVHGALTPGNVVVAPAGRVTITDLPLGDPLAFPLPHWSMRRYARGLGYLAPERSEHRPVSPQLRPRADVHSLGVLGLELFAGVEPDLHVALRDALCPAFDGDPSRRPASPTELLASVRAAARRIRAAGLRTVLVLSADGRRELVARMLTARDPQIVVLKAEAGRVGLEHLRTHRVDLVLADPRMPDMDAEAFVGELRARPEGASIPVVIVSDDPTGTEWRRLHALGVADLVPAPFDDTMLWAAIGRLLGRAGGEASG